MGVIFADRILTERLVVTTTKHLLAYLSAWGYLMPHLLSEYSLMVERRSPKSSVWVRFLLFVFTQFTWLLPLGLSCGKLVVS